MNPDQKPLPGFESFISENVSKIQGQPVPNKPAKSAIKTGRISENVADKSRGKRGRPAKFTSSEYVKYAKKWGRRLTQRTLQNRYLAIIAGRILHREHKKFEWVLGPLQRVKIKAFPNKSPRFRITILAELGRFENEDGKVDVNEIISAAELICAEQMSVRRAIGYCRRMREIGKPSASRLAKLIRATIKRYQQRYPGFSDTDIEAALQEAARE